MSINSMIAAAAIAAATLVAGQWGGVAVCMAETIPDSASLSRVTPTRDESSTIRGIAYRTADADPDAQCVLDLYLPVDRAADNASTTTIVWLHGGGLHSGSRHFPAGLLGRGNAIVAVDYRLTPAVDVATCIDDAAAAVAWVKTNAMSYGGDPRRIVVSGHSAGGYLTLMLGLDPNYLDRHDVDAGGLMGLAPLSGHTITHFTQRKSMGLTDTEIIVDGMGPLRHLRPDAAPMLCVTGDRELELLGRYEENAYFVRMMKIVGHNDITLHELGGHDHGSMLDPAIGLVNRFVERLESSAR